MSEARQKAATRRSVTADCKLLLWGATAKSLFELETAESNLLKQFALLHLSL